MSHTVNEFDSSMFISLIIYFLSTNLFDRVHILRYAYHSHKIRHSLFLKLELKYGISYTALLFSDGFLFVCYCASYNDYYLLGLDVVLYIFE